MLLPASALVKYVTQQKLKARSFVSIHKIPLLNDEYHHLLMLMAAITVILTTQFALL